MKKAIICAVLLALVMCQATGCKKTQFENPGDFLGGGSTGEVAQSAANSSDKVKGEFSDKSFSELSQNTSADGAVTVSPTDGVVTIDESGSYFFRGNYGGIALGADGLNLHFIFDGAKIESATEIAINGADFKKTELTLTLVGENSVVCRADGENAVHIKGSLALNGDGSLSVTSEGKNAVKVSKDFEAVDCALKLSAANHAIAALSVSVSDCKIEVLTAGKDGINAECDDETTEFTADEGYVYLKDVEYSCRTSGDGIQADTVVYIDGGTYDIETEGVFVEDSAENREKYELAADDFRYIMSGGEYKKVASDYRGRDTMYALAQGCKGIKVGEIEYPSSDGSDEEIVVTQGDYSIIIEGGTFNIDSTDDAIHANSGSLTVNGGTFTIKTYDDALTSDVLTSITGGEITVSDSYEGIEGGYVEISGGKISIVAEDDGINAASDDKNVSEHIIISGGTVYVNSGGDGIDSNGTILISGGETYVTGPESSADCSVDSERGTVITGGYLFAVGPLGMVETPAENSTQCVVSFARNEAISAGTNISLTDGDGNAIITFAPVRSCQSVIISCPELESGKTYKIYGGDSVLCEFTVSRTITVVGSSAGIGNPGGNATGGPGGFGGFGGPDGGGKRPDGFPGAR